MTDSFIDSIDLKDDIEVIHGSFVDSMSETNNSKVAHNSFSEGTNSIGPRSTFASVIDSIKKKPKLKRSLQVGLVLFIIGLILGGLYIVLLEANKPILCEEGQYLSPYNICE